MSTPRHSIKQREILDSVIKSARMGRNKATGQQLTQSFDQTTELAGKELFERFSRLKTPDAVEESAPRILLRPGRQTTQNQSNSPQFAPANA
jgi:hypothetical protein